MIKHAHLAVDFWVSIDNHPELTPRQLVYLCSISHGEKTGAGNVAESMSVTRMQASNHLIVLYERGFADRVDPGTYQITTKGRELIKSIFPFTYIRHETNASIQVRFGKD